MRNPFRKRRSYVDESIQTDFAEEIQEAFAQTSNTEFPTSRKVSTVEASTSANLVDRKPSDQRNFTDTAVNTSKISIPALSKVSMNDAATSTQWDDNQRASDQLSSRRSRQLSILPMINEDNVKDATVQTSVTSTPPTRHSWSDKLGDWLGRKSTNRISVSSAPATREGYSDKWAQTSYLDIPETPTPPQMDKATSVHGEDLHLSDQQYRNGMNDLKINKPVVIFPADKPGLFFMPGITSLPLLAPFPLPPFFPPPPPPSFPPLPQPPFNIPSLPLIQPLGHIKPKPPLPVPNEAAATSQIESSQDILRTLDKCRKLFSNSCKSRRSKDLGDDYDADYRKFLCTDPYNKEETDSHTCKCHENSSTAHSNALHSSDEIPTKICRFICRKHGTPRKHKTYICSAEDKRCSCQKGKNIFKQSPSFRGSQATFCPSCQCRYCCSPTRTFATSRCCVTRRNGCDGSTCQDNVTHINASLYRSIQLCLRNSNTKKYPKVKKYNFSLETLKILGTLFAGTRSTSENCKAVSDCHRRTECSCSHKGRLVDDTSSTAVHQTPTTSSCTCGAASSSSMKQKVPTSSTIKCSSFGRHLKQLLKKFDKELCNLPDRGTFQSGIGECSKVNTSCPSAENKCCGTEDNDIKCSSALFTCNRSDAIFTFCDDNMFNPQNCSRVYNGCHDISDRCGYLTCTKTHICDKMTPDNTCTKTHVCDKMTPDNTCAKKSMCDKMSCDKPDFYQSLGHCCGCRCECCRIIENPCIKEIKTLKEVCSVSSQTNITPEKTSQHPSPADNPDSARVFQPIAQESSPPQEKPHTLTETEKETHTSTTTAELVDIEADVSETDTDCQDTKHSSEQAAADQNSNVVATDQEQVISNYLEQELIPETEIKSINFQCLPAIEDHLFAKSCVLKRKFPCSDRNGQSGRKKPCNDDDHKIERENPNKYRETRSNDNKCISHKNPVTNDRNARISHDRRCSVKDQYTFSDKEGTVSKSDINKDMKKFEIEQEIIVKSRKESEANGKSSKAFINLKNESKSPQQPSIHRCKGCRHEDSYTSDQPEQQLWDTYTNHQPGNDEYARLKTSIFCAIKQKSVKIKDADVVQNSGNSRHDGMYHYQKVKAFSPCGVSKSQPPRGDDSREQSTICNIPDLDSEVSEMRDQRGDNQHVSQLPRMQTSTHSDAALPKQPDRIPLPQDDYQQVKRNNTFACKRKHKHNKIESSVPAILPTFGDKNTTPSLPGGYGTQKHNDCASKGDFVELPHIGNQQIKQDELEQERVAPKTTESKNADQFPPASFGSNIRSKTFQLPNVHRCRDCQIDNVDIIRQHELHKHKGYISNRKQLKIKRELDNNKVSIFCSIKKKYEKFKDADYTQESEGSHYDKRDDDEKLADVNSQCGVCKSGPSCVDKTVDVESSDSDDEKQLKPSVDRETISSKVDDSVGIIYAMSNSKYKDSVDPNLFGSTFSCKDNSQEQSTTCDLPDLDSEMPEMRGQKNILMDIAELLRAQVNTNKDYYNPNHNGSDNGEHDLSKCPPTSCQNSMFQCNCCSRLQENRANDRLDCSCTNLGHHLLVCRPCSRQFGPNYCLFRGNQHIHTNHLSNDCAHSDECITCQGCRVENCRFGGYFIIKSNCNITENSQNMSISYLDPQDENLAMSSNSLNTPGTEQANFPHTHSTKYPLNFECTNTECNQQQRYSPYLACFHHIFNTFAPVISEQGSRDNVHNQDGRHRTKSEKPEQGSRDNVHNQDDEHRTKGEKSEHGDFITISKTITGSQRIRLCLERGCRYNPCKHPHNPEECQRVYKRNLTESGYDEASSNTSDPITRSKQDIGSIVSHNCKRNLTDLGKNIGSENYHTEQELINTVSIHSNQSNSDLRNTVSNDGNPSKRELSNNVRNCSCHSKQELSNNVRNCSCHSKQELSNNVRNCSCHSKQELSNSVSNDSNTSKQELSNNVRNCSCHSKQELSNSVSNDSNTSKQELSNNVRNCSSHSKRELSNNVRNCSSHSKRELSNNVSNDSNRSKRELSNNVSNDSNQRKQELCNNISSDSNPSQRELSNNVNVDNMQRKEKPTDSASNVLDINKYELSNTLSKDSKASKQELSNIISNYVSRSEREESNVASNHSNRKKTDKINGRSDYSKRDLCDTLSKDNNEELNNIVNINIIVNKQEKTNDVSNYSKKRESQNNIHVVNDITSIKRCVSNTASYDSDRNQKDLNNAVCNENNFSKQVIRETINNDSSTSKRKINSTVSTHNNRSQRGSRYAEFNSEDRSLTDPSDTDSSHNDWKHKDLRETESNHRDWKHKVLRDTDSNHRDWKHKDLRETEHNHRDRKHKDLRETESNHRDWKHKVLRDTDSNHRDRKHKDPHETESNQRDWKHQDLRETEYNNRDRKHKDLRETESNNRDGRHTELRDTHSNYRDRKHTDPCNEDPNHTNRTHTDQSEAANNYKEQKHKVSNNTDPKYNERKRTNLGYTDASRKKQKHKDSSEVDHSHTDLKYKDLSDADNHKARKHKHRRYATQNHKDRNHKDPSDADPNHKDRKHKDSSDADPTHKYEKHKNSSYTDFIDKDEKHKDLIYTDFIDKDEKHKAPSYTDFIGKDEKNKDPSYTDVIDKDEKHKDSSYTNVIDKDQKDRDEDDSGHGVSGCTHSNHDKKNHEGCTLNYSVSFSDGGKQRFETHNNITYTVDQTVWSVCTETNIHPIPNRNVHETSSTRHEQGRIDIGSCDLPCYNCQCRKKRKRKLKMISDEDDSVMLKKYEPVKPEYCHINKEPCYFCADPQVIETITQEISHVNQCPATGRVHENQNSLSLSKSPGFPSNTFTTSAPQKRKRKHHTNIAHPCKWHPIESYLHFHRPESSQLQAPSNSLDKEQEKPHSSRNQSPEFFSNSFGSSGALNGYPKCQTGEPLSALCSQSQNLSYQPDSYMDVQPIQLNPSLCPSHSQCIDSNSKQSLGSSHRTGCSRTISCTCSSRLCNPMPCLSCGQKRRDLGRHNNCCENSSTSVV